MDLNSNEDLFKLNSYTILSLNSNINVNNLKQNIYIFNPLNINIIQRKEQNCFLLYNYNFINEDLIVKEDKTKIVSKDDSYEVYESVRHIVRNYDKDKWLEANSVKLNTSYSSTKNWSLTKTKSYLYCNKDKNVTIDNVTLNESDFQVYIPYSFYISNLKIVNNSQMKCSSVNFSDYMDNKKEIVIDTLDLNNCQDKFIIIKVLKSIKNHIKFNRFLTLF